MTENSTGTFFGSNVKSPEGKDVLKRGDNNKKLGFLVKSGRSANKNRRIYSLTLEERKTCPRSCHHWKDCYGNNMPFAHRFDHGKDLEDSIRSQIKYLLVKHKEGIIVRLHVLGDFYSTEYVSFWDGLLQEHKNLSVFGYTARDPKTKIGKKVFGMNDKYLERCRIRLSSNCEYSKEHENILYASNESFYGDAITCPHQLGKVKNCANCGLCWSTNKTIRFLDH